MIFPYLYANMSAKRIFLVSIMFFVTWAAQAQVQNDTILFEDGALYTGQISDSLFNGNGKMIYADNTIYNGEWKNGMWDGKGELHFPDGDFYQGEFHENQFNGYGVYHYRDGAHYEGNWKNGKFDGAGTMRYADGSTYSGEWVEDLKEGLGVLYDTADSSLYKGYFHRDLYLTSDHEVYYAVVNGNTNYANTTMEPIPEKESEVLIYSGFTCGLNQLLSADFSVGRREGFFGGLCLGVTLAQHGVGKPARDTELVETYDPETEQYVLARETLVFVDWDDFMDEIISDRTYHKAQILAQAGWRWKHFAVGGAAGIGIKHAIRNCLGGKGSPFNNGELYYREKITGVGFGYRIFGDVVLKDYYKNNCLSFRVGYGNGDSVFMGFVLSM